ncbi:SIR2 family protein [Alloprevotella tannerae]|uniref:SIR2 family protein n=1 Tax=Alloprevotella tannerae TaxID=76122 RepID=UPI0028E19CAB|nr:SIR2 family protein [Alloprevotella tannerae]
MENIPHGLKEAIEKDELVLFIGAGLSWDLKNTEGTTLGGWKEMVSSMLSFREVKIRITAEEQQSYEKLEPIKALKELKKKGIDKNIVGDFIKRYFTLGEENNLSLQEDLFKLSAKIITTNYDRAFEIAASELNNSKAYKTRNYEISRLKKAPVFLFKLHGCIEHIDSMVLFPSDYEDLYKSKSRDAKHVLQALRNLIFNKTFLFIGTGLGDHQINSIFKEIKRTQGNYDQGHFIITPNPLNKSLNFLTRIEINDYTEIPSVIKQLLYIKEKAKKQKSAEEIRRLMQIEELDEKNISLTEKLGQVQNEFNRISLLLEREANNRFRTGLKHHMAEEYLEASEEYKAAIELNPNNPEAYNNWGTVLCHLAQTKTDSEGEKLYKEACEKFKEGISYKKDVAYYNWGYALMAQAKTKSGKEAEELYEDAFEKYNLALKYGGGAYNLACLYAIRNQKAEALKYLEQTLARNEITVDFVEQDEDWKNLRNDPDFQDLLSRYKK